MPVALSIDVAPATAAPAIVAGEEIVIWRSASGAIHAWEDRCPHRGMRLSFGFVRGETLACLYHGWRFATDGACTAIPAHPDLSPPRTICTSVLGAAERGGLVWMRRGPLVAAGEHPPALPGRTTPVRSITIDAPRDTVWAALMTIGMEIAVGVAACPLDETETRLIAAILPVDDTRTTVFVLILGADAAADARESAARWGLGLRQRLEGAAGTKPCVAKEPAPWP